jgi:hypothetical protein
MNANARASETGDVKRDAREANQRVHPDKRRVVVYRPTNRKRIASAYHRTIRSWNWTVAVAVALMIALVLTTALSSHTPGPAASSGMPSHRPQEPAVSVADYHFSQFTN